MVEAEAAAAAEAEAEARLAWPRQEQEEDQEWFEAYRRRPVGNRSTRTARQFHSEAKASVPLGARRARGRTYDESVTHNYEHESWEVHQRYSLQ